MNAMDYQYMSTAREEEEEKERMFFEMLDVKKHVQAYLDKHLPAYELVKVVRKSVYPEDAYLYMVSAKKNDGTLAVWTCWNEITQCLNGGHYDLDSLDTCNRIFQEYQNRG